MNEYISSNIVPRLELLERQTRELQGRLESKPKVSITIKHNGVDELINDLEKLYRNFGSSCDLDIKIDID